MVLESPVAKQPIDLRIRALALFATLLVALPIFALLAKVPWSTLVTRILVTENSWAIKLSLWSSLIACLMALLAGVPLAWVLARGNQRITAFLRPIVLSPIVLPPTVAGIALLALLGRNGLLGSWIYDATGFALPFTPTAVVIAGIFVSLPFLVLVTEATFRQLPTELEDQARVDGGSEFTIFIHIALPQARNGIATGALLAWARALGEFGATMMFAGSVPGRTLTWPMAVYSAMDTDFEDAYALSAFMVLIAFAVVFLLRNRLMEIFAK